MGDRPVCIGRAPDNDLVLADDTVSWHHAVLEARRGQLWVRDLGSTNGTAIEEKGVLGEGQVPPGAVLRVGRRSFFRFLPPPGVAEVVLEDLETGLRFVVAGEPRRMGPGEAIALDIGQEGPALLMMRQAVFVVVLAGKEVEPPSDRAFFIGTRQFRLIRTSQIALKTVGQIQESHPYRLVASVGRTTGPEATLTDRVQNLNHTIRSENRAVLLYLLARRMVEDQAAGKSMEEAGWCTDEEVAVGIWGRDGERMEAGNLHVLVHRLRKEIEDAGFDSAFLEKHRRALRIRIVDVVVR